MGSSESGGAGLADSGAGSIVWVRRRNGSWWPGKILGPDELSASHLMSPRSGTPVKLLGREDASVDWYNLEKSKRVKAFRCGEFDDCIERAEASLGLPAKKREKYARREDAILHALELEKQFLEKKYGKFGITSVRENSSDSERKDLVTSSRALQNGNGQLANHELYQLARKVNVSNIMERNTLHEPKANDRIHPSSEEQNLEVNHRIRRLQDFRLRTVPVNRIYTYAASDDSNRMPVDTHACDVIASDPGFDNSSDSDYRNGNWKGKRSLEGFIEESLPKRRDKYHAESVGCSLQPGGDLVSLYGKQTGDGVYHSMYLPADSAEVFETNHVPQAQLGVPVSQLEAGNVHPQHDTFAEETTSGSSEETESDSSETHSLEPYMDVGMMLSDAETGMTAQPRTLDRLQREGVEHESTSNDESDEVSLDERSQFYLHVPNPSGIGFSKWQLKGKRNVRNVGKRPLERFAHRMYLEGRDRSLSQRTSNSLSYYHETDYNNDVDFIDDDFDPHTQGMSKRGYLPSQVAAKRQNFAGQDMIDWEELTWGRPFRGYWEGGGGCFNPMFVGRNGHDMLIDVDLKVQANRQGEHVPWVSLMSRLNGKAIIGHPIQIETVEDGSTDMLVSTSDACGDPRYGVERNRVPPVWRTARRTANFRVPRPHLSSQLNECDEDADNHYIHQSGKVQSKKSIASSSFRNGASMKKTDFHVQGLKKPPRKVNQSSNQKTKPLSSIGFDQKLGNKSGDCDASYYMDGVIKPVDSGPPAVACIPVKLVFSRLLEAVGRPPSGPSKQRGSAEQQQKERKSF